MFQEKLIQNILYEKLTTIVNLSQFRDKESSGEPGLKKKKRNIQREENKKGLEV